MYDMEIGSLCLLMRPVDHFEFSTLKQNLCIECILNYLVFNIVYGHFSFSLASYRLSLISHLIHLCMGLASPDYGNGEVHNTAIISNEEELPELGGI